MRHQLLAGLHKDGDQWGGYVSVEGTVVVVFDLSKRVASRILESVRAD
jgi:hypothetical protein